MVVLVAPERFPLLENIPQTHAAPRRTGRFVLLTLVFAFIESILAVAALAYWIYYDTDSVHAVARTVIGGLFAIVDFGQT